MGIAWQFEVSFTLVGNYAVNIAEKSLSSLRKITMKEKNSVTHLDSDEKRSTSLYLCTPLSSVQR